MTQFYNYNPEKKDKSFADIYLMAAFAAVILVFLLIVSGYGIRFLIGFVIKYYLWVLGAFAVIGYLLHRKGKAKRRAEQFEYH